MADHNKLHNGAFIEMLLGHFNSSLILKYNIDEQSADIITDDVRALLQILLEPDK